MKEITISPLEAGQRFDKYLVKWRCVREHEHEDDIAPAEFKEREGKRRHRRGNDAHNARHTRQNQRVEHEPRQRRQRPCHFVVVGNPPRRDEARRNGEDVLPRHERNHQGVKNRCHQQNANRDCDNLVQHAAEALANLQRLHRRHE